MYLNSDCTVRTDLGKGASRRLRRLEGNIPAVLYGGDADPISLTIPHKDIIKATSNEAFFSPRDHAKHSEERKGGY